ncbi:hypothetical protein E2C01_062292 [Portunus trituberculatus]|uniref:Uncharacterized protein n=1 Tax=Portunus trituberculatus TaxID=210409 RepID=A0A5B7H7H8_PORTR|nr:hypothetical protein [Portunus trituberculatus]
MKCDDSQNIKLLLATSNLHNLAARMAVMRGQVRKNISANKQKMKKTKIPKNIFVRVWDDEVSRLNRYVKKRKIIQSNMKRAQTPSNGMNRHSKATNLRRGMFMRFTSPGRTLQRSESHIFESRGGQHSGAAHNTSHSKLSPKQPVKEERR